MGRFGEILTGLIILNALIFGCGKTTKPDAPDETFYINLTPANITADVGDTLTLTGSINSVEGLFAISFDLVFDTSMVVFESLTIPSNSILGQNSISFSNQIVDGVSVSIGRTQTSGNDNVSASGPLFVAKFIAISPGTTQLQYRDVYIIDENGAENWELGGLEMRLTIITIG
ncbi:MAG: hypothetical protein JSW64_08045 [Candidatus Zixiibacteriota bacterium]|nr:MAG: hypothetical protein JSW64_08045 [candidate division Zixibacteria bacterium]